MDRRPGRAARPLGETGLATRLRGDRARSTASSPPCPRRWPASRSPARSSPTPSPGAWAPSTLARQAAARASARCLKPSAFLGALCFATPAGQQRPLHPARISGSTAGSPPDPEAADRRAVTRRYLAAYGPATREDVRAVARHTSAAYAGRLLPASATRSRRPSSRATGVGPRGRCSSRCASRARGERAAAARLRRSRRRRAARRGGGPRPGAARAASTAPRAGSPPCCSSTAGWRASGATRRSAARSTSRSSGSAGCAGAPAPPRRPRRSASPPSSAGTSVCRGRRPERTLASWGP